MRFPDETLARALGHRPARGVEYLDHQPAIAQQFSHHP